MLFLQRRIYSKAKGPSLSFVISFLLLGRVEAFKPGLFSSTCVLGDQKCIWHTSGPDCKKMVLSGDLGSWGSCEWAGVQLSRYPAAWAHSSLFPPIIGKDAVGAAGRMPVWTTLHPRSPYGIPLAHCMHSPNQTAKHSGSRP